MKVNTWQMLASSVLVAAIAGASVSAEWIGVATTPMPVDRLVKNLEDLISRDSSNINLRVNLARLHAYTFATKVTMVGATPDGWAAVSDNESDLPARQISFAATDEQVAAAYRHLDRAIARYREALTLDNEHLVARLGLAWCLEYAGHRAEAITEYRNLVEKAFVQERDTDPSTSRFKPFVTEEAGRRLIALLGKDDAEETRRIQARIFEMAGRGMRAITPLAVPLEPTWSPFEGLPHRAVFDADGTGVPKRWSWIGPEAAWLVYDDRGGIIDSALQLFGSVTFWMFWDNGYEALCALDDSGDGTLTGGELEKLALWRDVNINGRSDPGEVIPLDRYGITALSCRHVLVSDEESTVGAYAPDGVRFIDGTTRPTYDLILRVVPASLEHAS